MIFRGLPRRDFIQRSLTLCLPAWIITIYSGMRQKTNYIQKLSWFRKNFQFVMPDLIRHPEFTEVTGFRLPDRVRHRPRRNDALINFNFLPHRQSFFSGQTGR